MELISPLIFGISASLDALMVGMSFGFRGIKISFRHNFLISFITLIGTCLSVGLGFHLTKLVHATFWEILSGLILFFMGAWYLVKFMMAFFKKYGPQTPISATETPSFTTLQACALGCTLSANNMGIGLSASIGGLSMAPAAIVTLFFSFLFLFAGNRFGGCQSLQITNHSADGITGFLLVMLGLLQWMK